MQAFVKLVAFPECFRRACDSVRPALRAALRMPAHDLPADDPVAGECEASVAAFRVTDRLRRWTRARHFADGASAARYASAYGGVVWERYVGPTGAANWWSLSEAEWQDCLCARPSERGAAVECAPSPRAEDPACPGAPAV